jgi:hypothetical protein
MDGDIPSNMYDAAIESMRSEMLYSTSKVFKKCLFYKRLTPHLKDRIVNTVLRSLFDRMMYYFMDFELQVFAPDTFTRAILINLSCRIYEKGDKIAKKDKEITNLSFFFGRVKVYGYGQGKNSHCRYLVSRLPPGSFYGDFNILFNLKSSWDIEAD